MHESAEPGKKTLCYRATPHIPVFEEVVAFHLLHLAPRFLADLKTGAQHHLDRSLLKYSQKLSGVPLCYGKVEIVPSVWPATAPSSDAASLVGPLSGAIYHDNPCVHVAVKVYWTLFAPKAGARVMGQINVITREHLGLLFVDYFSAIIQASHMQAILTWDEEEQSWRSRSSGQLLTVGQQLTFEIVNFAVEGPVLTIFGSLDRLLEAPEAPVNPSTPKGDKDRARFQQQQQHHHHHQQQQHGFRGNNASQVPSPKRKRGVKA